MVEVKKVRVWIDGFKAGLKSPVGIGAVVEAVEIGGLVFLPPEWMEKTGIYCGLEKEKFENGDWWEVSAKRVEF